MHVLRKLQSVALGLDLRKIRLTIAVVIVMVVMVVAVVVDVVILFDSNNGFYMIDNITHIYERQPLKALPTNPRT